jgi:uncharacterized protein YndB with AHSA1/START domain
MSQSECTTVERLINARPEPIFDMLADPHRHAEIDGSKTVHRVKSGGNRLALGDKFVMGMRYGIRYSTVSEIVEFEENRLIAWQTYSTIGWLARFGGGRIWRYELQPADGGTLVRETWDITHEAPRSRKGLSKPRVREHMIVNMHKTLVRIEERATRTPHSA